MLQPWHLEVFVSWLPSGLGSLVQSELQPVLLIIVLTVLSLLFLSCLDFVFLDTVVVQLLIWVWFFAAPRIAACQASLSFTTSRNLLKLMSIESVMPSNHLILCRPLLFLPSIFPSIRLFSDESALWIRWPNYWSFSFSNSPSNEYSGLSSFRMDWLDLLASKGLSRVFSSTTAWKHQFFGAQLSLWSNFHICTWLQENHSIDYMDLCQQSDVSAF